MNMLEKLQKNLGYKFNDIKLLEHALEHKSTNSGLNNERLEFLGDAVLDLIVGEYLFKKFKNQHNEGDLSKLRAALVNEASFAKIAKALEIGECLHVSMAEERNGGRKKPSLLSDALEATMGAIYLESGLEAVRKIFIKLLEKEYKNIDTTTLYKDYKTQLQELTQAHFGTLPSYALLSAKGPDHKKIFEMALFLNGKKIATAQGDSKKQAEQSAAKIALESLFNLKTSVETKAKDKISTTNKNKAKNADKSVIKKKSKNKATK